MFAFFLVTEGWICYNNVMATNKEYANFILEQCADLSVCPMMGEYVLYYADKVVGGIYDNRLLVKSTPSARRLMPDAEYALPYEGAKEMLFVDNPEDGAFLKTLFAAVAEELPAPKKRNGKKERK